MRLSKSGRPHRSNRIAAAAVFAVAIMMAAGSVAAETGGLIRSIILPGSGQAHEGHYAKAAILAGAAIGSWVGFFATSINYNRAVESYDSKKELYQSYPAQLDKGSVQYSDITSTYDGMVDAWNLSEDRARNKNIFAVALVATYTLNLVDILISGSDTGEVPSVSSLEVRPTSDGVALVKSFNF